MSSTASVLSFVHVYLSYLQASLQLFGQMAFAMRPRKLYFSLFSSPQEPSTLVLPSSLPSSLHAFSRSLPQKSP